MIDNDNAEFEAAFAEATGQQVADPGNTGDPQDQAGDADGAASQADQPNPAAEAPPPAGQADPSLPDIWANASPEQRAAFEAADAARKDAEHRLKSDQGRVSAYQRDLHDLRRHLRTVTASVSAQEDPLSFIQSDEWKKAKADYEGDLGSVFQAIETLATRTKARDEGLSQLGSALSEADYVENQRLFEEQAPDWLPLLSGKDEGQSFDAWLKTQPRMYREAFERNRERVTDPAEAAEVVNRYRAHLGNPAPTPTPQPTSLDQRRAAQLDGAQAVDTKTPPAGDPADGFGAWFNQAAAEHDKKIVARR